MKTVYILIAIGVNFGLIGQPNIVDTHTIVFETAERCLRNVPNIRQQLQHKYISMLVECRKEQIELGK